MGQTPSDGGSATTTEKLRLPIPHIMDSGWDDALPYGKAFIEVAPDRTIWGTDWPPPQWTKRMMNDAEEVEILYRYVDGDMPLLRRILVSNPARLHGFDK